jgi:CheY-like chemotaxis protein
MLYSSYRTKIDLVLTDVDMPQMDGIELADRIRALDPPKRILLMSGRALDDLDGSEKYPMLSKPFLPEQLMAAVDSALET